MAQLSDEDRKKIWTEFMSEASSRFEPIGNIYKTELRAAVDAIDAWIDSNAASFIQAIPEPAKTQLTTKQKIRIFFCVAKRRWEVS